MCLCVFVVYTCVVYLCVVCICIRVLCVLCEIIECDQGLFHFLLTLTVEVLKRQRRNSTCYLPDLR